MKLHAFRIGALTVGLVVVAGAHAQTIDPFYAGQYSFVDLGSAPGVPANYGGLTLSNTDPNTMIIGGAANGASGGLYSFGVVRDAQNHIVSFGASSTLIASGEYNDGGLTYGPGGVLFASRWPVNQLGQYKPGSAAPDKIIDLGALGVASSNAAVQFDRAGRMKLSSYGGGQFYEATFAADGFGTFDITSVNQVATLTGGPEGIAYVPLGSALFGDSILVAEYGAGQIAAYDSDLNGNPIVGTRRTFMTGLSGAEGAFIDPLTGDFLFSTFGGGNHIIRVSGFAAVPEPASMTVLGIGALALLRRRRRS